MKRTWHLRIRKTHRYLGLFIGVQFLLWTLGGLYFSWTSLDEIHGDHLKKELPALTVNDSLVSPSAPLNALRNQVEALSLTNVQLIDILGKPVYQLSYRMTGLKGHNRTHTQLADAQSGKLRPPLSRQEAVALAKQRFTGSPEVVEVEYLTSTSGHHEYREKPLPAYAITFREPAHATVYVAAGLGTVQSVRTDPWRIFDWLWMLHTMDYEGRDNINNGLLRTLSVLGLLTIASGFALYGISSPGLRRKKPRKRVLPANV